MTASSPPDNRPVTSRTIVTGAVVAFVAALVLWWVCYLTCWGDFQRTSDALEYADIARNVVVGRGYVTRGILPSDLPVARPPFDYPVHRSPLGCLYLVPSVAIGGTHPLAVLVPSMVLYAVLAAAVWWLGVRLFGITAGVCAGLLFLGNYNLLFHALTGYPTLLFAALVTAVLVVAVVARPRAATVIVLGLLIGLAYLTRPNALAIGAGLCAVLVLDRRYGPRPTLGLIGVALLTVLPYLVMNGHHTGSPLANSRKYIMLFNTPMFPGYSATGFVQPPEPLVFFWNHPGEFAYKVWVNVRALPISAWGACRATGVVFALVGLAIAGRRDTTRRLRLALLGVAVGQAACDVLTVSEARFLIPLVPIVTLFAGCGLAYALHVIYRKQRTLAVLVALAVAMVTVRGWRLFPALLAAELGPKGQRTLADAVGHAVADPDARIAVETPEPVTWYADQWTLHLPIVPEEFLKAETYLGPVDWVVITSDAQRRKWRRSRAVRPDLNRRMALETRVPLAGGGVADIWRLSDP